jgi:hypothetical protein
MKYQAKPLYQPWSEEAFRSDIDVQIMTPVQKWMYRTLCQAAFVESTRPYLPDDDSLLWKFAGCESRKLWDEHKAVVRSAFIPITIDGVRLLSRKRIVDDFKRVTDARDRLKKLGRKGGKAKARRVFPESSADEESEESQVSKGKKVKEGSKGSYHARQKLSGSQADGKRALPRENPSPSLPDSSNGQGTNDLVDFVVATATEENEDAVFSKKAVAEIQATIAEKSLTREEIKTIVKKTVAGFDEFHLKNAGSFISAALAGKTIALRNGQEKKIREQKRNESLQAYMDEQAGKQRLEIIARQEKPQPVTAEI